MDQDVLNSYEKKGLSCPFVVSKSGEVAVAQSGESIKNEISQMTTVIFETIGAIGDIKIDSIEMLGDTKGLIMRLDEQNLLGSLFEQTKGLVLNNLWTLLEELKEQRPAAAVIRAPEEKPKVKLESSVLDAIKETLKDYLGDFTERIYKNQFKAQRIKVDEFYDEDARRLIFALGKAAGMIIGPSKGRDMTNRLLGLLK